MTETSTVTATAATPDQDRTRALLVLLGGACVIGLAPILVRLSEAGPASAAFWRLLFATPILAIMARANGGIGTPSRWSLAAGVTFALDLGFWHYGIALTSVGKATVLTNLTPVVVTAVAWIFLRQRPARLFLVAVGLAVAGAAIMAVAKGVGAPGRNPALGDTLSLITAVWYALYFLAISAGRRVEPASRLMFWSSVVGAPLLLTTAALLGEPLVPAGPAGWAACVALGVMHVAGQGSIAWALGRLPPSTAAVTVLVQPVVAAALGWRLFGEVFSGWQLVGAAVALGGVVLAQWTSRGKPA